MVKKSECFLTRPAPTNGLIVDGAETRENAGAFPGSQLHELYQDMRQKETNDNSYTRAR